MARIGTAYIEVQGDFSKIRRELAALAREGDIKIKADLDASAATAEKKELGKDEKFSLEGAFNRSSLAGLKATKQTFAKDEEFNLHGAFDLASLASVKAAKESLGGEEEVKVRFDLDVASLGKAIGAQIALRGATAATVRESGALADIFNRSSLSIGQMVGAALLGAPIILDLAAALSAVAGSAAAATAGLGALAIGGAGVGAVGLGGILSIAGPAISSLKDVMSAQEAANKSQATGAKSAGLATMASAQQIKAAHQQVADATRGVTTAEQQLELAQESELFAQEALTQAREDATRQLQDMRRAAIEGETAEERARLSLQQANENLNRLLLSGTASALDLADADLSIVEARQNLRDVTIDSNRAQQDFNRAQRDGVSGMPGVISAQQSLDSAVRGVEDAQQGVAEAHRGVASALENLALQQRQANQATVAGGASMAALARAQRKAGPAAVKLAETLGDLGRRWRGLTRAGRSDFFRMLNDGVDRLNRKLPLLAESANDSMRALRRGFGAFLDRATGPEFNHFIHVMTRTFAKSIGPISKAFGNIAKVLQRIAVAVAPDIVRMSKGFEDITQGWLDSTKNAKGLRETVHGLVKQAETWWGLVKAVGNVLGSLFTSGMDEGKSAIKGITDQLNEWAAWIDKNPKKMHEFFANGLETAKELAVTIGDFFETFVFLGNALRPLVRGFIDLIQWLNSIKLGNISALTALISVILAVKTGQAMIRFAEGVGAMATKLSDLGTSIRSGKLRSAFARLRGWFSGVTGAASRVASAAADWVGNLAAGIRLKAGKIRTAIGNAMRAGRTFITSAATSAAEWAGGLVSNIKSSRLGNKLKDVFKRIATRMGKIMAGAVAAAVVVGEGIGGAAASLSGLMRERLGPKMSKVGKFLGRKFGVGFVAGFVLALPFLAKELRKHLPGQGGDSDLGGALWKDSPFSVDLPGGWWAKGGLVPTPQYLRRGGAAMRAKGTDTVPAMLTPGEFVFRREAVKRIGAKPLAAMNKGKAGGLDKKLIAIMRKVVQAITKALRGIAPQGFQRGGVVGRRGVRPGPRDKIPALLEIGELVIPKKMVDQTKKNAKAIATDMGGEIGKGYKKVSEDSKDFVKRHGKSMETLRKTAGEQTDKFRKTTGRDFEKTGKDANERTKKMRGNVVEGFAKMRASSVDQSGKMKSGVGEDFRNLTGAVGDGLRKIAQMTNNALKALGVKRVNFNISTGGGRDSRRQTGGMVVPGTGVGDKIRARLPVGSGIVNRKAADVLLEPRELALAPETVKKIGGPKVIDRINRVIPRFQEGGVVDRTGVHHFQAGGYVGMQPEITKLTKLLLGRFGGSFSGTRPGDPGFHGRGLASDIVPADWAAASRYVNSIGPSLLEGIYNPGQFGGSAVSWDTGKRVSSSFWGSQWANHLDHIHIATESAVKGAIAMAKKLKKVTLEGPEGAPKDLGQAALDKTRKAADEFIASKQVMSTDILSGLQGSVVKVFAKVVRRLGAGPVPALALFEAGLAESGMRDLPGGHSSSQGPLQLLASTAAGLGVSPHDISGVASLFLTRGFYGQGGAMGIHKRQPGLPASMIAQMVQGSAFSDGSNYAAQRSPALALMKQQGLSTRDLAGYAKGGMLAPFVGSFARGGEVKRDGLAMVHKGEKVLPRPSEGLTMHQVLRGLKRALNDDGKALRQFLDKFHRRLDRMDKSRLREFARKLDDWGGPAAKKLTALVRRELHDRPRTDKREEVVPMQQGGMLREPRRTRRDFRRERDRLREDARDVIRNDNLGRKQQQKLITAINAQIEASKALQAQTGELRRDIKEHNDLYKTLRAADKAGMQAVANFVSREVGHQGHQKTRNAGYGVDRRY